MERKERRDTGLFFRSDEEGSDSAILESEGTQPVLKDKFMREVRNGRRSPEIWRREEGFGSSGQVVGRPHPTSCRISSGERGEKEVKA